MKRRIVAKAGGTEKKKKKKKEKEKEKIPHMCESIGHRPLWGRCPKGKTERKRGKRKKRREGKRRGRKDGGKTE